MTPEQAKKIRDLASAAITAACLGHTTEMFYSQEDLMAAIDAATETEEQADDA